MSCNFRGSFLESDEFYATSLHFLSILQAPIHIFGIYIILKKTPKSMEKVKFPILLLHLICVWCDFFVSILATPVFCFLLLLDMC
ncbi:Protein CBR-SRH-145 [Caenorhabditis briggsae]|uniref:Protein CBR-SRH-145 n=1 Tax=Caenorhabditis briggsae TaxID=6238 RepID=A8XN12_CAEBR|nr:Protein CBR-SRH-145 [Caenorhabditis briggsae]CAP34038.2 Protein CBR-SRH-145 [Caenorhabditis briggsae]